jgi:hypothetical protein
MSYIMVIDIAGPNMRDRIKINGDSPSDLEPLFVNHNGIDYERYGDDDGGYIEIRRDHVVTRNLKKVPDPPDSAEQDREILERFSAPPEPPRRLGDER